VIAAAASPSAAPLKAWTPAIVAACAALALGLIAVHAEAIAGLRRLWDNSPMYSYGYLVPFVAAFLVWSRRDALAALPRSSAPVLGAGLVILWMLLLLGGRFAAVILAEQLALVVAVAAVTVLVWGWLTLRTAWAGIAYLLLMVPLWDGLTEPLHPRFQNLSAAIGVRLLELVGVPAHRDGTFITLPSLTLEVARACSGVNYLVAVLALGLPLAYLYLKTPWRRVMLVVSAVLIAALSNSLRVAIIGVLVHLDVGAPLHGPGHMLQGLFVSGIGYVALFVGLAILRRGEPTAATAQPPEPAVAGRTGAPRLTPVLTLASVFWATAALGAWRQPAPVVLSHSLDRLAVALGPWTADPYTTPQALPWWPDADDALRRTYHQGDRAVDVHIGYFRAQRQSREVATYQSADIHRVSHGLDAPIGPAGPTRVNFADRDPDGSRMLTLFWYELDGRIETAPSSVKLRTFWNAIRRGRTNGAVIALRTADPGAAGRDAVIRDLVALAGDVHRGLAVSLPGRGPELASQPGTVVAGDRR
jgi:EpsI family protein